MVADFKVIPPTGRSGRSGALHLDAPAQRASRFGVGGALGDHLHHGGHSGLDSLAGGLSGFDIDVQHPLAPLAVEMVHQRQQAGGLAGLARRVEQEVFFWSISQPQHLVQIPVLEGWQRVVVFRPHRAIGVEKTHEVALGDRDRITTVTRIC